MDHGKLSENVAGSHHVKDHAQRNIKCIKETVILDRAFLFRYIHMSDNGHQRREEQRDDPDALADLIVPGERREEITYDDEEESFGASDAMTSLFGDVYESDNDEDII